MGAFYGVAPAAGFLIGASWRGGEADERDQQHRRAIQSIAQRLASQQFAPRYDTSLVLAL
jgi:hypothetical protein